MFATAYYKLAKEDSARIKAQDALRSYQATGGQKVSAYWKRTYNLLGANGAGGTPSTQQNCGRSTAPTRLPGRQWVASSKLCRE